MPISLVPNVYLQCRDGLTGLPKQINPESVLKIGWDLQEQGGLAQLTASFAVPWETAGPAALDTLEAWVLGETVPRARGIVSTPERVLEIKETQTVIAYGRLTDMDVCAIDRVIVIAGGGDLADFAAQIMDDYADRRPGNPFVRDIQVTGIEMERLDARSATAQGAMQAIFAQSAGTVVWGWDIDPSSGLDRFYLRPRIVKVGYQWFVGATVQMVSAPLELAGVRNAMKLTGGPARYPNLLTNADFEDVTLPAVGSGSLLGDGGFELSNLDQNVHVAPTNPYWTFVSGAYPHYHDDYYNYPQSAHSGRWFATLTAAGQEVYQEVAISDLTQTYKASLYAARENGGDAATGRLLVEGRSSNGSVLETHTLTVAPASASWSGGQESLVIGSDSLELTFQFTIAGVTKARVRVLCDTTTGGQGLLIDDVVLNLATSAGQNAWQSYLQSPSTDHNNYFNSIDWACRSAAWQGAYGVRCDVAASGAVSSNIENDQPQVRPADDARIRLLPDQDLRHAVRVRMTPGRNTQAGQCFMAWHEYATDGHGSHYSNTIADIPNDGNWYLVATDDVTNGDAGTGFPSLSFSKSGVYDVDGFESRDVAATAELTPAQQLAEYLPGTNFQRYILCTDVCATGTDAYNSIATYGLREAFVTNANIVDWTTDAETWAAGYFAQKAVLLRRPRVQLTHESVVVPDPGSGLQMRVSGIASPEPDCWPAHVTYTFEKSSLKVNIEGAAERPTPAKLLKSLSAGSGTAGGGGSASAPVSGGGISTPLAAPVQSVQGQTGAVVLTPAELGAEPALGDPDADGYVLSSTKAGVRSWVAPPAGTGGGAVTSVAGRTGDVTLSASDISGLGTAATQPASAFDAAGAAASAQAAAEAASDPVGSAASAQAASLQKSANLSDLGNASTARTNLGLGTAAVASLPAAGSNASAGQVVRGDDTRLTGSGLSITEAVGSGADVTLTTTYATIPNLSVPVAAGQAVAVDGLVEITADAGTGLDDLYVQLYDTVAAAPIANSERHISYLPAGKRGLVTVEKFVPGIAGGRTLVLQAKNGTAARGSVSSAKSLLQALAVTSGTSSGTGGGTGGAIVKPPAGTALKTSGTTLINGLVLCLPLNEGSGTTIKDWVSGTTATLGAGWSWTTQSGYAAIQGDGTQSVTQFTPVTQVTGDWTILAIGFSNDPNNSGNTDNILFGQGTSNWGSTIATNISNYLDAAGGSVQISQNAPSGMVTLANVKSGGTLTNYSLASGSPVSLATGTDSTSPTMRSQSPGVWLIGAGVNTSRQLNGYLTALFFWNRALTAAELSSLAADPYSMFAGY